MSKTSWQVKQRYNRKVYGQLATQLPKDFVDHFKAWCKDREVSQAQVIKAALAAYAAYMEHNS